MKLKALKERRYFTTQGEGLNIRSEQTETGERYIEGYAALFNHESKVLAEKRDGKYEWFTEFIEPGAFDDVLSDKANLRVLHTIDHDNNRFLGRTESGTLQLSIDEKGLKYRVKVPNTTLGNDTYEMIQRGDYYESSFVFTVDKLNERWDDNAEPKRRYISKVSGLYDTSTVTFGAYSDTAVKVARFLLEPEEKELTSEREEVKPVLEEATPLEQPINELDLIRLKVVLSQD